MSESRRHPAVPGVGSRESDWGGRDGDEAILGGGSPSRAVAFAAAISILTVARVESTPSLTVFIYNDIAGFKIFSSIPMHIKCWVQFFGLCLPCFLVDTRVPHVY